MIKRKSKNIERMLACLMAFMMVIAFYPVTAHADKLMGNIDIPSHVDTTGSSDFDESSKEGTYSGVWKANIPFAQLLKPYEGNMSFGFPWAKNGGKKRKEYAYVDYTVTFPENIQGLNIGTSTVNVNTAILDNKPQVKIEGNKVHFILRTSGLDFPGIKKKVNEEIKDISKHMVNIEIPYTVKTKNAESAKEFDKKQIVGTGDFTTEQKFLFSLEQLVYDLGTSKQPFTKNFAKVFSNVQELPIIKSPLPGDFLLNGDTQSDKVIEVTPENSLKFTGSLDVSSIKKQMKQIEQQYGKSGADLENIKLHNPESTFTAKIILPKGLKAKNNLAVGTDVQLEGAAGTFAIVDAKNDGNGVIIVKMTLQNTDKIKNYKDLKEAVDKCADELKVNISAIQLEDTVKNNEQLTVKGELTGTMGSVAEYQGKAVKFSFEWKGEQKAGGKDSTATDDKAIQLTLKVKKPEEIQADAKLKGDILIGADTEHDAIFETKPGNIHDFTGALDVSDIKKAMNNYKTSMAPNDPSSGIKLEDTTSKFTATFTLPEGMEYTLPKTVDNVQLLGAADTFKITNVVDNGKSIDVEMTLKQGIDDFDKLEKAINACDDTLKVIVKGVKVSDNTTNDQKLQVKGSIIGNMKAKAKLNNDIKNFNLNWTAVQSDEGRDKAATDNESITFTLNVNKPETYEIKDIPLEGDILINGDTEHDKVYETEPGAKLDYTGALNIAPIKDKMDEIEGLFGADPDKIMLEGTKSEFTATFTLPEYGNYKDGIT